MKERMLQEEPESAQALLWQRIVSAPDDEEAHEAYLAMVAELGVYAEAARNYRHMCSEHESVRPYLERVQKLAIAAVMTTLASQRQEKSGGRYKNLFLVLMVLLLFGGFGAVYTLMHRSLPKVPASVTPQNSLVWRPQKPARPRAKKAHSAPVVKHRRRPAVKKMPPVSQ